MHTFFRIVIFTFSILENVDICTSETGLLHSIVQVNKHIIVLKLENTMYKILILVFIQVSFPNPTSPKKGEVKNSRNKM